MVLRAVKILHREFSHTTIPKPESSEKLQAKFKKGRQKAEERCNTSY